MAADHSPAPRAPGDGPALAVPEAIGIAKGLKGVLLWVGGSLAGITAVFYACGYLVTRAHMSMLGLYGFVNFNGDHFLQEGAKFLLAIGKELAETLALLFVPLGLLLLVPGAIAIFSPRRRAAFAERLRRWREDGNARQAHERGRCVLYAAAFVALVALTGYSLDRLYAPLEVANLLYGIPQGSGCAAFVDTDPACLRQALLRGDEEQLATAFGTQLSLAVAIALLACVTWWIVMAWRWRGWLIAPFLVSVGLCLLLLPMDYGVLQRPTIYPVVHLVREAGGPATGTRLFLINKSTGEFVVWDEAARKVAWIPAGSVSSAEIVEVRDLFEARPPPKGVVR
jgi:hypothetical protein